MEKHDALMALTSHPIVEKFAKLQNMPTAQALDCYYKSELYNLYEREDTKVWHYSRAMLGNLLNDEYANGELEMPTVGV